MQQKKKRDIKIILSILVVAGLSVLLAYLVSRRNTTTLKKELSDFAVPDTAAVDQIFLADRDGNTTHLTRKNGEPGWTVNGKYDARQDAVNSLLETICRLEVKAPVGRASFNNVIRWLSSKSTKVEIYSKQTLRKVYYVGGATSDQKGTYMIMENSSSPFIMHIPGFEGYLYTRYYAMPELWRSNVLARIHPEQIKKVSLVFSEKPSQSWAIEKNGDMYELFSLYLNEKLANHDNEKVKMYLNNFKMFNAEGFVSDIEPWRRDSILSAVPRETLTIETTNGKKYRLDTFNKVPVEPLYNEKGVQLPFDPDRFYGMMNQNKKELILLQYFAFEKFIPVIDFFAPEKDEFIKRKSEP